MTTLTEVVVPTLSADDARTLTDEVKADAAALWTKLVALYEGGAHTALGYTSWKAYCRGELDIGPTQAYQLLDAGRVARRVRQSTNGGPAPITERVARELVPVEPDDIETVWGEVVDEHGSTPTAAQTRKAVIRHFAHEAFAEPPSAKPRAKREEILANAAQMKMAERQCRMYDFATAVPEMVGRSYGKQTPIGFAAATVWPEKVEDWRRGIAASIAYLRELDEALDTAWRAHPI